MKSFKSFIREEVDLAAYVRSGKINIDDEAVRDNINTYLNGVTAKGFINPHSALEKVSKALAYFHIMVPNVSYLENNNGVEVFQIQQFGNIVGMNNDGKVVTKNPSPYHLYFEYQMGDDGFYKVFAEVVDEKELDELINDVEDDMEDAGAKADRDRRLSEGVLLEAEKKAKKKESGVPKGVMVSIRGMQNQLSTLQPVEKIPKIDMMNRYTELLDSGDYDRAKKHVDEMFYQGHINSKQHKTFHSDIENYKKIKGLNEELKTRPDPHLVMSQINDVYKQLQTGKITYPQFLQYYQQLHSSLTQPST